MTAKSSPIMCGHLPSPAKVSPLARYEGSLAQAPQAGPQRETLRQSARASLVECGAARGLPLRRYLNMRALSLAMEAQLRCLIDLA